MEEKLLNISIEKYNDYWMDNALENFYSLLKSFNHDNKINISLKNNSLNIECATDNFKEILIEILKNYKQYACVKIEDENGIKKEFKKDFIIIQHKRKEQKINLNPKLFQNPDEEISKLVDSLENGKKTCVLCGNSFKKKYDNLTQGSYPFSTKIKSLSGVRTYKNGEYYTFKDYNDSVCPVCSLIGILGWLTETLIYRSLINEKNSYLFLPNLDNLKELHEFKQDCYTLLNSSERWSNIKISEYNEKGELTEGKYSTLLCFYSRFLLNFENTPNIKWSILNIPLKKVKNVKLYELNMNHLVLKIVKSFIEEDEDIYNLFRSFLFFKKDAVDWDLTNKIRENLSESFINNDFRRFSKNFVPKNGGKLTFSSKNIEFLKYFDLLIKLWMLEPMGITENDLRSIKNVGNIVAKVSVQNSNLFYKLDKIKTIDDFWSVLREISRKLVNPDIDRDKIREMALDELIVLLKTNEKKWKEIRDLLVVYSAIYYSINLRKSGDMDEN